MTVITADEPNYPSFDGDEELISVWRHIQSGKQLKIPAAPTFFTMSILILPRMVTDFVQKIM